jgi:DNA-binding IclR family transcriptional regulator
VTTDPIRSYCAAQALQALQEFSRSPLSVRQLAERLQVHRRTAQRLVRRLAHDGYLERVPSDTCRRSYRLSAKARALGYQMLVAPSEPTRPQ